MDCVLKHEVDEVGVGLDELVELLQVLQLASLLLVENIEVVFGGVELHVFHLRRKVCLLLADFLVSLLQLFLLFLKRSDFLVDLLLHHLVEVLLLNLELLHNPSEGLFEAVDFVVELLAHLEFQLGVEFLAGGSLAFVHLHLVYHFLDHALHIEH